MGSLVPFEHPNFYSDPSTSSTIHNSPIGVKPDPVNKNPTLEILTKPEPIDENPDFIPSSPPHQTNLNDQNFPFVEPISTDVDSNVYAEFSRVTEMCRSAFAERMARLGDIDVLNSETGAIVPVQSEENPVSAVVIEPNRRQKRSNELVRVTSLNFEDERYFRDLVRRTRMLYDALWIHSMANEEKRYGKRGRGDLRAASLMKDRGLWINIDKRIVGSVPGVYIGDLFYFRMELCIVGLHGQIQAGIDYLPASQSSNGEPIATSIVVSGGYEDDEDGGDVLVYTGHGGQDRFSRMTNHQKLEGGNLALERSMHHGLEIRVIRGLKYGGLTTKIYVYDGLYKIVDCWSEDGKSGFGVYKFKLIRIEGQPEMGSTLLKLAHGLRTTPLQLKPEGYLTLDLSMKKENVPVFVFNDIDSDTEPLCYDYLPMVVFPPFVYGGGNMGCNCATSCTDGCLCGMKNGGEIAYDQNGFLFSGKPLIFECGSHCSCPPNCRNRVSQKGLNKRLEVFRSRETGWGVRTLDLIHAGSFICEYTGVALTREQAELCSMTGDGVINPGRFAENWSEWGNLSQVYPHYVRPTYPSIPRLDFAVDVSSMRNVACYISQSTFPNVMVQFVLYDHNNISFPHLMLFAMENIPPMRELSLDYGGPDEYTGKLAICS